MNGVNQVAGTTIYAIFHLDGTQSSAKSMINVDSVMIFSTRYLLKKKIITATTTILVMICHG
jgi:hypothetical protein